MSLVDIVHEITEKQVQKTETGDQRILGVVAGIVAENYSQEMPGRLKVQIPVRDQEANQLKWAKMAVPYTGKNWGQYFMPEKNDQVLLIFEHGNIEMPYIIGSIPRDNDSFVKKSSDEKNSIKEIRTRYGNRICFEDRDEGEGDQDKISIFTAKDSHHIILDNEKKVISFSDREKNCSVKMQTEKGSITIQAAKKMVIQVGDTIKITMNGESGSVGIEAEKVSLKAGRSMEFRTDGTAKCSGQQISMEASSMLKLSSNGMITAAGSPIKLG